MSEQFRYKDSRGVSRLMSDHIDPHRILAEEIGPAYEDYRRRWEAARTFQEQPAFPIHVDYEMMFRCNLSCPMCLMSLPPERRRVYGSAAEALSPEKVRELIDEGARNGQCAMGFGGLWEPLLSPAIPDLVAYGRSKGLVDALFNTNGFFLTEDTGRALIDSGLTKLMISLDAASEEVYAQMRVGSDFNTVASNIEKFMNLRARMNSRLPLVRLSFCRTALNEHELEPFLERWHGLVDFFSIQAYGRYESADPPGFPADWLAPPPAGRCAQPHKRLLIRHNGDIMPCCDASGTQLVMGNVHKDSLFEIWNGPKLAELRQRLGAGDLKGLAASCQACQDKFETA
ncbi:hypothetical protein C4J81_11215 [Deltaproteobacteria bacterium Smac51]|nr:hypothetical protein C4J81_11215 [Deltaproteobacteria bacterium Smac51]